MSFLQFQETSLFVVPLLQVYLLCRWERHLAGFPHLGVVDRWPATPKRARIAH